MRCFIALPLPAKASAALARILSPLRGSWPALRWVAPEAYHLTLAFLGDIDEPALACAQRAMESVSRCRSFGFSIPGFAFLPPRGAPRVLYARLEERPEGSSAKLYALIHEALAFEAIRAGIPPLNPEWGGPKLGNEVTVAREVAEAREGASAGAGAGTRAFKPHVTLARLSEGAASVPTRGALGGAAVSGEWTIDACVLYKSQLRPAGPVYTELKSVALLPPEPRERR